MRQATFPFILVLALSSGIPGKSRSFTPPERIVFNKMIEACNSLETAKFQLRSTERMPDGKLHESEFYVKLKTHPRKLYLFSRYPSSGLEVLWNPDLLGQKMLINPNGFPYINLKFSAYHPLVRKDTHHTIHEIGFDYLVSMIDYYMAFYGDRFFSYLSIKDTVSWEGRSCIVVNFDFTDFDYILYTVSQNENLTSIGNKLHVSDYSLLSLNPSVKEYDDIHPGQIIKVPNFYNRRIEFWVDRATWLPLVQCIYDNTGLFEKYELRNFLFNPEISPDEFTPGYGDYGF